MELTHKDHPYLVGVAFTGWTAASYLNYVCTQLYSSRMSAILELQGQRSPTTVSAVILTIFQTALCLVLLDFSCLRKSDRVMPDIESNAATVQDVKKDIKELKISERSNKMRLPKSTTTTTTPSSEIVTTTSTTLKEIMTIIVVSHISGSFITTLAVSVFRKDFVIIVKFMEPVITAIFYKLVFEGSLKTFALLLLGVISGNAFLFGNGFPIYASKSKGHFLALTATVLLSTRNLAFKGLQSTHDVIRLRQFKHTMPMLLVCLVLALGLCLTNTIWGPPCLYAFLSSLFHITNSYISICVILKNMSVISHAVVSLWKRLLVVALLAVPKSKRISPTSASSLAVCFLGLVVFLKGGRIKPTEERTIKVPLSEQSNRLLFIVFLATVSCLLFYNFPLRISQRDMETLAFLRMDGLFGYIKPFSNRSVYTH